MLKNISASDKNLFVELSEEFYRSPAVLHKIPVRNHSATFDELIEHICSRLFILPNETIVYPGHMGETKIEYEKLHNPYVQEG